MTTPKEFGGKAVLSKHIHIAEMNYISIILSLQVCKQPVPTIVEVIQIYICRSNFFNLLSLTYEKLFYIVM